MLDRRIGSYQLGETVNLRYKAKPLGQAHAENSIPEAAPLHHSPLNIW